MLITILSLLFFLLLWGFGFAILWLVLRERRLPHALVLAPFLGIGFSVLILNAVGYLVPIQTAFSAIFFLTAAVSVIFLARTTHLIPWQTLVVWMRQEKRLLIVAGVIMITTGLMAVRATAYDDVFWGMLPLAETIRHGNFPVMHPLAPDYPVPYHYGPPLFVAAANFLTSIPTFVALDVVTTLAAPLMFLLLFLLLQDIFRSRPLAWGGTLIGMLGGSWSWINGATCGRALFDVYVRGNPVDGPFACAYYMLHGPVATPLFGFLHQHGTPVAFGLVFTILWWFIQHREDTFSWQKKLLIGVVGAIFFAATALFHESYLMTLVVGLFAASIVFKTNRKWLAPVAMASLGGLLAAYFQGGILKGHEGVGLRMTLNPDWTKIIAWTGRVSIFDWNIAVEVAALVIFVAIAIYFAKKRGLTAPLAPFIFAGLAAFAVPILFWPRPTSPPPAIEKNSVLYDAARFWSFGMWYVLPIVGAALGAVWSTAKQSARRLVLLAGFFLILTSLLWPLIYIPLYPIAESGIEVRRPFVGVPYEPPPELQGAVDWIKKNTLPQDRILVPAREAPTWARWTGRFFPAITWLSQFYPRHALMMSRLERTCDPEALRFEKISFVLATGSPATWESSCLARGLLTPAAQDNDAAWRIFRVTNL